MSTGMDTLLHSFARNYLFGVSAKYNHGQQSFSGHLAKVLLLGNAPYLTAAAFASLLGAKHALWYGILYTEWRAWQGLGPAVFQDAWWACILMAVVTTLWSRRNSTSTEERPDEDSTDNPPQHSSEKDIEAAGHETNDTEPEKVPTDLPFFKPILFPSRTTHRRLYPQTHSFNYSYLLVGIPILQNPVNKNSMLSTHPTTSSQQDSESPIIPAWFSVHATDYLQRGPSFQHLTLRAKLDLYLKNQNISNPETAYPYAYLITAPRFLGFSFNPVSFWYLYDKEGRFTAMILEVNNTFDERRMYLLRNDSDGLEKADEIQATNEDGSVKCPSIRFTNQWNKDFHVSPFNDRDGTYSVNALDLLRTGSVDVTIVLSDDPASVDVVSSKVPTRTSSPEGTQTATHSEGTTKLIARIFSTTAHDPTSPPLSHSYLSRLSRLRFIATYGLIGFLTNPRILIEARKLWWNKGLTVFYRPEPFESTIPRVETGEEIVVEEAFRRVLAQNGKRHGVTVEYTAAAGLERGRLVELGDDNVVYAEKGKDGIDMNHGKRRLRIHVLTPAFYSELAMVDGSNGGLEGLFERLCFNAKPKEKMIDCSSAEGLRAILADTALRNDEGVSSVSGAVGKMFLTLQSGISTVLQNAIDRLRLSRSHRGRAIFSPWANHTAQSSTSSFDKYVHALLTPSEYFTYQRAVLTIVLADKLALGNMALLRFEFRLLRVPVVLFLATMSMRVVSHLFHSAHASAADVGQSWIRLE